MRAASTCPNLTPGWFTGRWQDWHRGHGCAQDDGQPRSKAAVTEIAQHAANQGTGYLTDAEMACLRARTTSGDTLLVRALHELGERRAEGLQRHAALVEALDIFDATRCPEPGHGPKPEQSARILELRRSTLGSNG
jgi:hypothetical protein